MGEDKPKSATVSGSGSGSTSVSTCSSSGAMNTRAGADREMLIPGGELDVEDPAKTSPASSPNAYNSGRKVLPETLAQNFRKRNGLCFGRE